MEHFLWTLIMLLPPANEVCKGNVFTGSLSVHHGVPVHGGGLCPGGGLCLARGSLSGRAPPYGGRACGTHPTGMHSCLEIFFRNTSRVDLSALALIFCVLVLYNIYEFLYVIFHVLARIPNRHDTFSLVHLFEFFLNDFRWIHWIQWIVTKHKIGMVTRNTPCLVIIIFWDEVVKMKFLLLCLDRYLFNVVNGNRYL